MGPHPIHENQQEKGLPLNRLRSCILVSAAGAQSYGTVGLIFFGDNPWFSPLVHWSFAVN